MTQRVLSKENLSYYDTKVKPLTVKDIELENSNLKVTKRDGTTKNIPLSSGGSFTYEKEKDYTTLYFTENALKYLGYTGFNESNLLKYRSFISKFDTNEVNNYNSNFMTNGGYTPKSNLSISSSYSFNSLNKNLRVNVKEKKTVSYLDNFSNYLSKMISEIDGLEELENAEGNCIELCMYVFDENGTGQCKNKGYVKQGSWKDTIQETLKQLSFNDYNDQFEIYFKENCSIRIAIAKTVISSNNGLYGQSYAYGAPYNIVSGSWESTYMSNKNSFDNEYKSKEGRTTFIKDLCTYEEFVDYIEPLEIEVIPVQVPCSKTNYGDLSYGGFGVYTYKLLLLTSEINSYISIMGQSIGNGTIIDSFEQGLTNKAVVESDSECGTTTFSEVYPL